jgi:hypothetical protein
MTDWSHAIPQREVTECYNALKSARNVRLTLFQVSWENPFTSILIEFSDHTGSRPTRVTYNTHCQCLPWCLSRSGLAAPFA